MTRPHKDNVFWQWDKHLPFTPSSNNEINIFSCSHNEIKICLRHYLLLGACPHITSAKSLFKWDWGRGGVKIYFEVYMKLDLQYVKCWICHIVFPKTAYPRECKVTLAVFFDGFSPLCFFQMSKQQNLGFVLQTSRNTDQTKIIVFSIS